jgi:hypothetical protein
MGYNAYSFQHGHPKYGGRIKGTPNKIKVSTVREFFTQNGLNPIQEIIGLMGQISDPARKAGLWVQLLSWYEPRPSRVEIFEDEQPAPSNPLAELPKEVLMDMLKRDNPDFCQKCWANISDFKDSHVCR